MFEFSGLELLVLAGIWAMLALPVAVMVISVLVGVNRKRARTIKDERSERASLQRSYDDLRALRDGKVTARTSAGHLVTMDPARVSLEVDGMTYDLHLLANGLATPAGALVKIVKEHGRAITTAFGGPLVQLILAGVEDEAVEAIGDTARLLRGYEQHHLAKLEAHIAAGPDGQEKTYLDTSNALNEKILRNADAATRLEHLMEVMSDIPGRYVVGVDPAGKDEAYAVAGRMVDGRLEVESVSIVSRPHHGGYPDANRG